MRFMPIRRANAVQYFQNVVVSFVVTLLGIRIFLALTGYPQVAGGVLHIAHVSWGGLSLLVAAILALMYKNKPLLTLSSILAGIGWGAFIDEIGKFITVSSDYFFRPAAPIIYVTFLCLWFLAAYFRRKKVADEHTRLYHLLDGLEEAICSNVDPYDLLLMREQLVALVEGAQDPGVCDLAGALLRFFDRENRCTVASPAAVQTGEFLLKVHRTADRVLQSEPVRRIASPLLLVLYAAILALNSFDHLYPLFVPAAAEMLHADLIVSPFSSTANLFFFLVMNAIRVAVVILLLRSAFDIATQHPRGWRIPQTALILEIALVDLLVFYFNQFAAALVVMLDLVILAWINYYRRYWQERLLASSVMEEEEEEG